MQCVIEIPGKPMGKQRPKFGKGITYTPKQTVNYENYVKILFKQKYPDTFLAGELRVIIETYFKIPKNAKKSDKLKMATNEIRPTKKPDCDNIAKIILDALNGVAYYDDKQVVSLQIEKYYATAKEKVTVEIQELKDLPF